MDLVLKDIEPSTVEKLNVTEKEVPCLDPYWHYHSQYELLYVSQGRGIRFVGDSVSPFFTGDLVLVGPYLPHLWRDDVSSLNTRKSPKIKTVILKFTKDFIGEKTFDNPTFSAINDLLEASRFGISFGTSIRKKLHPELMGMVDLSPAEQSIKLLDVLCRLSQTRDRQALSSTDMRQFSTGDSQRIDLVLKYISDNYTSYISLKHVADIACLTTNSFCRFFKKKTNKSFTRFLNEVRIRNAARLLVQKDLPVSEVCYMVGYQSVSNFNKQFKLIMGRTPKSYRLAI